MADKPDREEEQAGPVPEPEEESPTLEDPPAVDLTAIPEHLPLLPLGDAVVYPYTIVPLAFDDEARISAVDEAMRGQRMVGVVSLVDQGESGPREGAIQRADLEDVGTVAVIHRLVKLPDEGMRLLVQGVSRFRIVQLVQTEPFLRASILVMPETTGERTDRVEALLREGQQLAEQVIFASPYMPDELHQAVRQMDDPEKFSYMVASMIRIEPEDRQRILASDDLEEKLTLVMQALRRELRVLEIGGEIKTQVEEEVQQRQREYFLREQLKAIKEELGEAGDEEAEVERLRACLQKAEVPDYVMEAAEEQLQRLANVPPASPEYSVIINYVDWLCQVPWNRSTDDRLDLEHAREVLDEDHYDLQDIKDRVLEYLAVRKLKDDMHGPILGFVGPPGVGKTSLGKSIARALGREFVRMSLGGMRDEAEIRGHRRTYIGALPGRIVQSLKRAGTNNPVFMLDEIDKVGADFRGDPSSALLEVLDPEQNDSFRDHYLDLPFDLSNVLFIATANVLDTIQPALLDRMEMIRLPGYTDTDKLHIARQYLVPKQVADKGLTSEQLEIADDAIQGIIAHYTREAGVRGLEREIAKVSRKVAARIVANDIERATVTADELPEYLGPRKAFHEVARRVAVPGVATGLAWTAAGGEILFVEATTMPGSKGFSVTGQLGNVMEESARAALAYVRSHASKIGIDGDPFADIDIHLHVPSGAVPKDGPSAGVAMATAIASAVTGRRVRPEVAMTGEITLTGQVLPVGGIKEKMVAAKGSDIRTVILPARNREHVDDIEKGLIDGLEFVYAETIADVLNAALLDTNEGPSQSAPDRAKGEELPVA